MNQPKDFRPYTCSSGFRKQISNNRQNINDVRPQTSEKGRQIKKSIANQENESIQFNVSDCESGYYSPKNKQKNNHNDRDSHYSPCNKSKGLISPTSSEKPMSQSQISRKRVYSMQRSDLTSAKANSMASTQYKTFNGSFYSAGGNTNKHKLDISNLDTTKFVDGMYSETPLWGQSVSTWRHASPSHKFSQTQRFPDAKLPGTYKNQINIPSTIKKRSTSFGYGKNTDIFPPKHIEKASTTPAPNSHKVKRFLEDQIQYKLCYPQTVDINNSSMRLTSCNKTDCSTERNRQKRSISNNVQIKQGVEPGKSFGLSYEHYRKNYLNYADKMIYSPLFQEKNPPPNAYDVSEKIGQVKKKFTIYKRLKMFNEICDKQIPPVTKYKLNEKLVMYSRFKNTSFGLGKKINIAKPLNNNPGPKYAVKRDFDEFDQLSNHYNEF